MTKQTIPYPEFLKIEQNLEIRVGQVVAAKRIPKKDKLLELTVIFGVEDEDQKTSVTNLGEFYEPDEFLAQLFPFITNLEPSKLGGVTSEVMIMVGRSNLQGREGKLELIFDDYTIGSQLM